MLKNVILIIVIFTMGLISSCGVSNPPNGTVKTVETKILKEWAGTGIKATEPFSINAKPWVIVWKNEPLMMNGVSMGILQISVHDAKSPALPLTLVANTGDSSSDTSYVYQTGEFFLTINAANTNWTVKVYTQ